MRLSKWLLLLVVFAMLVTVPLLACGDDDDDDDDGDDDDNGDDDDDDNNTGGSTCSAMCNKMSECLGSLMDEYFGSVDECISVCSEDLGSDENLDCMTQCNIDDSCITWGLCIGECGEI